MCAASGSTGTPPVRWSLLAGADAGSVLFFKNGAKHGPGYPAGSVTGPVAAAVQMYYANEGDVQGHAARLLPGAEWPAGKFDALDSVRGLRPLVYGVCAAMFFVVLVS